MKRLIELNYAERITFLNPEAIASIAATTDLEPNADQKSLTLVTLTSGYQFTVPVRVDILRDKWMECYQ